MPYKDPKKIAVAMAALAQRRRDEGLVKTSPSIWCPADYADEIRAAGKKAMERKLKKLTGE